MEDIRSGDASIRSDEKKYSPKSYHLSMITESSVDDNHTREHYSYSELFIQGCLGRERRAVVAISKTELLTSYPKESRTGGRFVSNLEFNKIVASIKDSEGFIIKDKIEVANIEITEVLVPGEPKKIWKSEIIEVVPSYLKPNNPKLSANYGLWRGPYSGKFGPKEQRAPKKIIKPFPQCFIVRYFNNIPSYSIKQLKTMLEEFEAKAERLRECKGPGIERLTREDINLECSFEKLTNKAISALKERWGQINEEEVNKASKCRGSSSNCSAKLNLEDRKHLILKKALKEGKVFNYFKVAEMFNSQELGQFYLENYENDFNKSRANLS